MKTDITTTINSLPDLLSLKKATEEMINSAEEELDLTFADEFKKYLREFGAIIADGIELTGIANSEHRHVVPVTKEAWNLNPNIPHKFYVIEDTHVDGIVIWQEHSGKVYRSAPNSQFVLIANSMKQYIERRFNIV